MASRATDNDPGERDWVAEDKAAAEAWEQQVVRDAIEDIVVKHGLFLCLARGEGPVECDERTFDHWADLRQWVQLGCHSVHVRSGWKPTREVRSFLGFGRKMLGLPGQYRITLGPRYSWGPWVKVTGPLTRSGEPTLGADGTLRVEYSDEHTKKRFPVTPEEEAALHWLATMVVVI